jgi:putative oxidoreductase
MKLLTKIQDWGDRHHPKWLSYLRILLGIILMWKGIAFALNLRAFTILMENVTLGTSVSISLIAHLIIALHLIGGLMIALGTHTRLFCLLNMPVLFCAVFFVNLSPNIFMPYSELWLSSLVFVGLICFLIEGNGKLSIEYERERVTA